MTTRRRLSRDIHKAKLARREDLEGQLVHLVERALKKHDPTALPTSVRVAARLTAVIASQIVTQTQVVQRTLLTLEDDISEYGTEFVSQLLREGQKAKERRVERFTASPPFAPANSDPVQLADDWAGPVAGPTAIERYYGIPRSTLYRWQKLNEAVALGTRTSSKPVFPLKQFVDGRPAAGIAELIQIFGDARKAWQWLVQPHHDFEGHPPLDALINGKIEQVLDSSRRDLFSPSC
ncbi:MAG: MbcA/ParS/Xre antitoxin family protein [Aquamicrobium sp.]|uniref:antitoxin Xre/MbcA/ParS-like domain-containing protein n=1 Tax=Aquamicrobium sp. TaxID=1872579 RepID=UPI00349EF5B6|nr:MbcA/ParS/Xre antitoxin family protein [Aquamicrobium sp.]MCO5155594.1 MbcA/ParS/Xre antitoxin family protein [Aquamicrobium sp.]